MTITRRIRVWLPISAMILTALACDASTLTSLVATPTPPARPTRAPAAAPASTPTPSVTGTPMPAASSISPEEMAQAVHMAAPPAYDPHSWAVSLGSLDADSPRTRDSAPSWEEEDTETFALLSGDAANEFFFDADPLSGATVSPDIREIDAELRVVTDRFYGWVDTRAGDEAANFRVEAALDQFVATGMLAVEEAGGSEWIPGMDADERLHIVYVSGLGQEALFRRLDEFPIAVYGPSAEREVLFVDLDLGQPNTDASIGALTRAYWRMVQFNLDANEPGWAEEGMARLVASVAGFPDPDPVAAFSAASDTRLDASPESGAETVDIQASVGASFLYHAYLRERALAALSEAFGTDVQGLGLEMMAGVSESPLNGFGAIDLVIQDFGVEGISADSQFFDWTVANLIDNPDVGSGQFGYTGFDLPAPCPVVPLDILPKTDTYSMQPYSAHYHELLGGTALNLSFDAPPTARLLPEDPIDGGVAWWSGRGNWIQSTLTRSVSIPAVTQATLDFSLWYDIPPGQDAFFVLVSTDGGESWTPMQGPRSTPVHGLPAYAGKSGGGDEPTWVLERIDLTDYVEQEILLRFAYVTDGSGTGPGVMLDGINIPQAGFADGAEAVDPGWEVEGWLRTSGVVANQWGLYVVSEAAGAFGAVTHTVTPIVVEADGDVDVTQSLPENTSRSWVVVARAAPGVDASADYTLALDGDFELAAVAELPSGGLVAENFEASCGVFREVTGETFATRIVNGALEVELTEADTSYVATTDGTFDDVVISVDTTLPFVPTQGALWGAACRASDTANYYGFELRGDGSHRIIAVVDGELTELTPFEVAEDIETGGNAANNLVAACVEETLSLTVNGTVVASVEDTTLTEGQVGVLLASGPNAPVSVSFDNFVVTGPTGEGGIPSAAATPEAEVCDCSANLFNCSDFAGREDAQACFNFCGGRANDVHLLDADFNGIVCETVFP